MKLKLDAVGNAVVQDGKPVYVYPDGKEIAVDAAGLFTKITELNGESKTHRLKAKEFEDRLSALGDVDPNEVGAILSEVKAMGGIDAVKKLASADVIAIRKEIEDGYTLHRTKLEEGFKNQLTERDKIIRDKEDHIYKLEVSNRFKASKFISDKLTLPADIAEATFGNNFKIEDGKVVAYLGGNRIYSREKPGEYAEFEEAITTIVEAYPMKDRIIKGNGNSGTGAPGNQERFSADNAALANMNPVQRITAARAAGQKT